jgi:hypothetical protein
LKSKAEVEIPSSTTATPLPSRSMPMGRALPTVVFLAGEGLGLGFEAPALVAGLAVADLVGLLDAPALVAGPDETELVPLFEAPELVAGLVELDFEPLLGGALGP